jgi:hypothetical protein
MQVLKLEIVFRCLHHLNTSLSHTSCKSSHWENYYSQGGEEYPTSSKTKEGYWIGYTLCMKCFLKHVTDGKTEGRIKMVGR